MLREKVLGQLFPPYAVSLCRPHAQFAVGPLILKTRRIIQGLLPFPGFPIEVFPNNQKASGKIYTSGPANTGKDLIPAKKSAPILLLISDPQTRNHLWRLLVENHYFPVLIADQEELFRVLRGNQFSMVLIDCAAVSCYGARTISKIKVACRHGRIIVFCDKAHLCDSRHRDLIKEILAIGVYACIVAPYREWEVLSLVAYDPQRENK